MPGRGSKATRSVLHKSQRWLLKNEKRKTANQKLLTAQVANIQMINRLAASEIEMFHPNSMLFSPDFFHQPHLPYRLNYHKIHLHMLTFWSVKKKKKKGFSLLLLYCTSEFCLTGWVIIKLNRLMYVRLLAQCQAHVKCWTNSQYFD